MAILFGIYYQNKQGKATYSTEQRRVETYSDFQQLIHHSSAIKSNWKFTLVVSKQQQNGSSAELPSLFRNAGIQHTTSWLLCPWQLDRISLHELHCPTAITGVLNTHSKVFWKYKLLRNAFMTDMPNTSGITKKNYIFQSSVWAQHHTTVKVQPGNMICAPSNTA